MNDKLLHLIISLVKLSWDFWKSNIKCHCFHIETLKSRILNDKINIRYVKKFDVLGWFLGKIQTQDLHGITK